ncbi:MAG TPA: aminoacyl-tRNA hydrolase [Bacilli bacterium]|nr:aminoacyl-tRNA hydrolase [Bacilli bacterium]
MKLFVGLGNPGTKYQDTRHNMGFMVVDAFASKLGVDFDKNDFKGSYARFKYKGEDIVVFKPQTFMNLSGEAVLAVKQFFKVDLEDIVVVFDDLDLEPGQIRLRLNGSSGGQKGMQNITELLGTQEIKRIRIGIGKPVYDTVDFVLGRPEKEEKIKLDEAITKASNALKDILDYGFLHAMAHFNVRAVKEKENID